MWVLWIPLKFASSCLVIYHSILLFSFLFFFLFCSFFFILFSSLLSPQALPSVFEPWLPTPSSFIPDGLWLSPASFYIPIILKSSSTSSFNLVRALLLFTVPCIVALPICFVICWQSLVVHCWFLSVIVLGIPEENSISLIRHYSVDSNVVFRGNCFVGRYWILTNDDGPKLNKNENSVIYTWNGSIVEWRTFHGKKEWLHWVHLIQW